MQSDKIAFVDKVELPQSTHPDYDNFIKMNSLVIGEDIATNGSVATGKSFRKKYALSNKNSIEASYLYIEASVNGRPLSVYDDLYLKINDIGGHIIIDKNSLPVLQKEDMSVYLFPLNAISFKKDVDAKPSQFSNDFNFLDSINNTGSFSILAHINSQRKNKRIIKISIGYDCNENNSGCSIG